MPNPTTTNEKRSNDQRIALSIDTVKEAVKDLQNRHLWAESFPARAKIALIKLWVQEKKKRDISSGTLYQPHCVDIWNKKEI